MRGVAPPRAALPALWPGMGRGRKGAIVAGTGDARGRARIPSLAEPALLSDGAAGPAPARPACGFHLGAATLGESPLSQGTAADRTAAPLQHNGTQLPMSVRTPLPSGRSGNWITLNLVPREGNRDALGTSVRVEANGIAQRALVHGAVTYLSQIDRRVHFGLGAATVVDRLEITWPGGRKQEFRNLPVSRFLRIEEGVREVK